MRICVLVIPCLLAIPAVARADDETDIKVNVAKLLDPDISEDTTVFRAFESTLGSVGSYIAYSSCISNPVGQVDCEATVMFEKKKEATVKVKDATNNADALAAARDKLAAAMHDADGVGVEWYQSRDFTAESPDIAGSNATMHWDRKKKVVTFLESGIKPRKIKLPKLRKGLGLGMVQAWAAPRDDDMLMFHGLIRVVGIVDHGNRGDAVVRFGN